MLKLFRIQQDTTGAYLLSEIFVNVGNIFFITENLEIKSKINEGKIQLGINPAAGFSDIYLANSINGSKTITVVGQPDIIETKINSNKRQLLRD